MDFKFINQKITNSIQRTGHNLIYTADDEYVGRGGEISGKLRRANKGLRRGAAAEEAEDGMANEKMIRRKLIAEDQILINDSEDATSEQMEDDSMVPSYVNVMVSWLSSYPFRSHFYEINFCRNKFKTKRSKKLGQKLSVAGEEEEEDGDYHESGLPCSHHRHIVELNVWVVLFRATLYIFMKIT